MLFRSMVISTLYSLGNVLSVSAGADAVNGLSPFFDGAGSINGSSAPYTSQQALGSQISLLIADEDETTTVYGAVVQAIVAVASACNDEKIENSRIHDSCYVSNTSLVS